MSDNRSKFHIHNQHKSPNHVLPYRPGVGMCIINKNKHIFVGKRVNTRLDSWQMPQGGIKIGETPSNAAIREMEEEIGSNQGKIISESKNWYSYRIPKALIPKLWEGQYCGQRQKWFLIKFTGHDDDININTKEKEFEDWRWMDFNILLDHIIPFKYKLYKEVLNEFCGIIKNS